MKRWVAEFIGTFALVFCGTGAIVVNEHTNGSIGHVGIAMTFGLIVMAMIYTFGHVSGAHFNPVVTVGFALIKKFPTRSILPYVFAQLIGALLASLLLRILFPGNIILGATLPSGSVLQSFVFEFVMTFLLMLVIVQVAHGSKEVGTLAGIAIGATVLLEAMFGGPISGASMNPARSFAPAVVSGHLEHLWIYIAAPFCGSAAAVLTWKYVFNANGKTPV
jgi:aquaporin NIP